MSANFYDLLKCAATGIASPSMTYYDRMRASMLMGGAVQTLTGVPPLSFKANGKPLISWSMKGNGQQTGTPTPDAPIMPEFVGVRTWNLFDKTQPTTLTNKYLLSNGEESSSASGWAASAYIPVSGDYATLSGVGGNLPSICAYDSSKQFVRGMNYRNNNRTTLNISDCSFVRFSYVPTVQGDTAMLNSGTTALDHEPYGYKIPITCAGQTTPVYLGQTQTVRRIKKFVLTGEETFVATTASIHYRCRINIVPKAIGKISTNVLSTHYFTSAGARDGSITLTTDGSSVYFTDDTNAVTAEAFKAYLASEYAAGHPVTVWYVLAEPETAIVNEPLAKIGDYADELHSEDADVTIPTIKGINTLAVGTDLQPSEMTIVYQN